MILSCEDTQHPTNIAETLRISAEESTQSDAPITEQLCFCALQSFLFQNKAASVTSENTPLPSDANAPSETPAGVSLSHLSQSAVSGLKDMSWMTTILLGVTGATAGVASGLLGIGGGTVVTPLLAVLTPLSQVPIVTVQQTHTLDRRRHFVSSLACKYVCTPVLSSTDFVAVHIVALIICRVVISAFGDAPLGPSRVHLGARVNLQACEESVCLADMLLELSACIPLGVAYLLFSSLHVCRVFLVLVGFARPAKVRRFLWGHQVWGCSRLGGCYRVRGLLQP